MQQLDTHHYRKAHENLRLYLARAKLPPLQLAEDAPPVPSSLRVPPTDFQLAPEPDSRRRLRHIMRHVPYIKMKVRKFIETNIPNRPITMPGDYDLNGDDLNPLLPATGFPISLEQPPPAKDIRSLTQWIESPLVTAERIVRTVWKEEAKGFILTTQAIDLRREDAAIYRNYYWRQSENIDEGNINQPMCSLIVAVIAPWAMGQDDMKDFVWTLRFPAFAVPRENEPPPRYERKYKVWAKLWDDCSRKRCPFFVLSMYNSWAFGVFVNGWTSAVVSTPIASSDSDPSVVEWLVYWISAAMKLPGSWSRIPSREDINRHTDITNHNNIAIKLSSEWDENVEELLTHEEWLKKYHRCEGAGGSGNLSAWPEVGENVWVTVFDD